MASQSHEEQIIKTTIELLSFLTSSTDQNDDGSNAHQFDNILFSRLSSANVSDTFKRLTQLIPTDDLHMWPINNEKSRSRWKFVCTNLQLMRIIRNVFARSNDEKGKLLSISQTKVIKASFELVVSLGILQNLLPGVGVPLECRSKHIHKIPRENLTEFGKYRRLCHVMEDVCYLLDVDVFHDLIVARHLEDVLAALFQLSFAPLKKPVDCENKESIDLSSFDDNFEIKDMTFSVWQKLEEKRRNYRTLLMNLFRKIYKPLLVRKLSLLNSKSSPQWMKKKLTNFLSDILKEKNGVSVTITALMETDSVTPDLSSHCVSVAKLIAHECLQDSAHIAPQLLNILKTEIKEPHDLVFIQVAVLTINSIFSADPEFANAHIFEEIYKPFKFLEFSTEEEICNVVQQMYNLFVVLTNNLFSVPIRVMMPTCRILFHMHCRIKDSVCYLKSNVRDLLMKFISETDGDSFASIMNCFIFNIENENIFYMPPKKNFSLSASGGVNIAETDSNILEIEAATVVLDLIKSIPENEKVTRSLFIYLLRTFIDETQNENFAQKRLISVILLTELSQCPTMLSHILKDSESIINFVGDLLRLNSESTDHDDIISVGLTFLTMVLYDMKKKKNVKWEIFNSLLPTMEKLRQHLTPEVKFLAEEVCNLIKTRGLIGDIESTDKVKKPLIQEVVQSDCERNIEKACDKLLPVRAHALMELISLIKKGDPETLAKKEKIYCLFEENLKDQDSFLYLRAIEGLSCMALLKPDAVLPLLCQEFVSSSNSTMQLKIGEVLVRSTKLLNDFVHPHKQLLVCTFMNGVKSEDSLIRASSLSNLAEVCLMLERNVEDMLHEVLSCALSIAQFDKDVEPRRAAILLVSGLFRGLKTSIFTVLESHLMDLYRTLKRILSTDADQVVQAQASQALEILNENTRQLFSAKPNLEKKIHIMQPL